MFGNLNKPAFGSTAPNTSFGFGATSTANANPFGQSQLFGKSTGTFGPSTSSFGQPANTSLFPSTQAGGTTNLFQNANTTFGAPTSTPGGFGSSTLFGQQQPSTSGLFNTSSTFGQQNKPTGFGFGTPATQPSLFGQQPQQQQASSIFQPSTTNLFGGTAGFGGQQTGTVIKFNPVTGTDTMMKNGVAQSINTKHHSITCMKEYENKSFEELRFEDYLANRKGPQQQAGFGATPFGGAVTSTPSLFGQTDASKSAFGQTTGFGQTTSTFGSNTPGFGLGNQQQQAGGLFGKPTTFPTPSSGIGTMGFGSTPQNTNPFGATQAAKPFGSTMQPIFGTNTNTTQQSGFGTGLFGQSTAQNAAGSLFGKPAQPTTGFGTNPTTPGFSFGPTASTQGSSLFQSNKPLFGQTNTTGGFGTSFTSTSTTPFNTFGKTTTAFGTSQPSTFGTSLGGFNTGSTSFFGNTTAKPGGLFGNTGTTGLLGNNTMSVLPNTGFGFQQQQPQQSAFPPPEQHNNQYLAVLSVDPFGDSPHLLGLEPKIKNTLPSVSATDPKELKALLDPQKKVDMSHNSKLKVIPLKSARDSLFDGLSPQFKDGTSPEYQKTSCRRLILKARPNNSGDANSPSLMKMDILKHILSDDNNKDDSDNSRNESNVINDIGKMPQRLNFDQTMNDTRAALQSSQTYNIPNGIDKNSSTINIRDTSPVPTDDEDEPTNFLGGRNTPKSYACGIICTRPEYYTLPTLEELSQYVDENGACIVKGFTVGRKGYGNVYFPDEMDVYGLNIDELVHFRYREINVYPDDSKKPPVGQGLNCKAQVTLDNVYPRRSATNTLIKDVKELLDMNFAEKLRRITVKKGAKFVDYRPETGSWVFKVDHFSRYGFNDSDEEAEQIDKDAEKKKKDEVKKPETEPKKGGEPSKTDKSKPKEQDKENKPTYSMDMDVLVEEGDHFTAEDDLPEQSMYMDEYPDDDYHVVPQSVPVQLPYDPFSKSTSRNIQVMKSTLFSDDDRSSDGRMSQMSLGTQFFNIPEDTTHLPIITEEKLPVKRAILRPRIDKVYNFGGIETPTGIVANRTYMDLGMFKGKSFKVGWGRGFDFFGLNKITGEPNMELSLNTLDIGVYCKDFDPLQEFLGDALEVVLEESSFDLDGNLIPTFKIQKGDSYLKKQTELFSKLTETYNSKESSYLHSIWTLAQALWGPGDNSISNRRHLLSEWLTGNTNYDDLSTSTPTKRIFNQLSVFKIAEAADLAMDERLPNLSLLIAQLSVTNRTKLFLQEQIENWYTSMIANHINDDMKRIYLLLSGIPLKDEVNIFHDVDWKRAFGMHLWYICPAGAPVEIAIELYKEAFESKGYAQLPNPPYNCNNYEEDDIFDVLYHILMLYKTRVHRLSSVLNPATYTDDSLDYRLSWLLLQLFLSLDVGLIDDSEKTKLCTSFSNQLESLGKWEWAIFVLLHLEDNALKRNIVLSILDRNLPPGTDKKTLDAQNNLVNRMRVPAQWIHNVKAEKSLLAEQHFQAFNHFAHAENYVKANEVLMEHILPSLFINEQYDIIKMLIYSIQQGSNEILGWEKGAGLFWDFLSLQENVMSFMKEDLLKLQMELQSISDRIALYSAKSDTQKLCISEMSKRCASVYKELCKKSKNELFKNSYADFVEALVMPPDFKQDEALYLINEFASIVC